MPDGGRVEQTRGELVEQRLEGVVVVVIDEHDLDGGLLQPMRRADPREPTAEDEDPRARVRLPTTGHRISIPDPVSTAKARTAFSPG